MDFLGLNSCLQWGVSSGETLRCFAPPAATRRLLVCPRGLEWLSLTCQLAEGGDESGGDGLELVVGQGDAMDPLGDAPHGFVDSNGEGHQFAVGQICAERDPGTS